MGGAGAEAITSSPSILAKVVLIAPLVSPHSKVLDDKSIAGLFGGTPQGDRGAQGTVGTVARPVAKGKIRIQNTIASRYGLVAPVSINEKRVGVVVTNEICELAVVDAAVAALYWLKKQIGQNKARPERERQLMRIRR